MCFFRVILKNNFTIFNLRINIGLTHPKLIIDFLRKSKTYPRKGFKPLRGYYQNYFRKKSNKLTKTRRRVSLAIVSTNRKL
jgi:hypothetical protein